MGCSTDGVVERIAFPDANECRLRPGLERVPSSESDVGFDLMIPRRT